MPIQKRVVEGRITVTRSKSGEEKSRDVDREVVGDVVSSEPLGNVGLSIGRTKNLGSYESARVEVSIHIPCTLAEVDEAFESAEEWVVEKLDHTFAKLGLLEE